jgi:SAM-dependent methyltransferase
MDTSLFEKVEWAWSQDSGKYDEHIQKQLRRRKDVNHWQKELQSVLGPDAREVLDVGCGPGFFSILLLGLGYRVSSVDGAEGMVEQARKNIAAAGFEPRVSLDDAVKLDRFQPESIDAIVSRDVVWTLYDPEKAFVRWKDLLREGGKVVIYDGNYRYEKSSIDYHVRKGISGIVKFFTEGGKSLTRQYHTTADNGFEDLPMVQCQRPLRDIELLQKAGYSRVEAQPDQFRNSPLRLDFWKYGYQGKRFRVIAYKQGLAEKQERQ